MNAAAEVQLETWVQEIAPFGRLSVTRAVSSWNVIWRPTDSLAAYTVAGPFGSAEAAQRAARDWLFDSWNAIEAQLGDDPEPALKVPSWWLGVGLVLVAIVVIGMVNTLRRAFG